ncbi:hypothetical protein DUNSADRAFT_16594, partial [Dunaliella salina]
ALQGKSNSQQQQHFHASLVLSLAICSASDASPECRTAASVVIELVTEQSDSPGALKALIPAVTLVLDGSDHAAQLAACLAMVQAGNMGDGKKARGLWSMRESGSPSNPSCAPGLDAAACAATRQLHGLQALAISRQTGCLPALRLTFAEALPIPDTAVVPLLQTDLPYSHGQPSQQQEGMLVHLSIEKKKKPVQSPHAPAQALPIPDAAVVPVLQAALPPPHKQPSQQQEHPETGAGAQETPSKKAKKSAKKSADAAAESAEGVSGAHAESGEGRLDLAVLLLEVLQWKAVQVQQLLEALVGLMGPLAQPHSALASSPKSEDEGKATGAEAAEGVLVSTKKASKRQQRQAVDAAAAAATASSSSLAGYAAQLILTLMESAARRRLQLQQQQPQAANLGARADDGGLDVLSMPLVVRVAQQAPDSAVRNAALSLLAVLAAAKPAAVLSHVLEVLAIVHRSSATTDDSYSHRVGLTALSAVVPAWLEAGKDLQDLWASVVDALPSLPAHRRLGLLTALLQVWASPQEASLPCALVTLLQAAARALQAPPPEDAGKEHERLGEAAAALRPSEWLLDLATQLSLQVPPGVRLLCFASLLPASVQAADGEAAALLPRIAVTFVAEQIKSRSLRAHHTHDGAPSDELQKGCEALMAQALSQVQALVSAREQLAHPDDSAARKGSSTKKSGKASDASSVRKQERAIRLSIEGLYKLFEGLQGIMASQSYMEVGYHPSGAIGLSIEVLYKLLEGMQGIMASQSYMEVGPVQGVGGYCPGGILSRGACPRGGTVRKGHYPGATRLSTEILYNLLEGLQANMASQSYMEVGLTRRVVPHGSHALAPPHALFVV